MFCLRQRAYPFSSMPELARGESWWLAIVSSPSFSSTTLLHHPANNLCTGRQRRHRNSNTKFLDPAAPMSWSSGSRLRETQPDLQNINSSLARSGSSTNSPADMNAPPKTSLRFLLSEDNLPLNHELGSARADGDGVNTLRRSRSERTIDVLTESCLERVHNKASLQFIISATDISDVPSPEATDDIAAIVALGELTASPTPDVPHTIPEEGESDTKESNGGKRKRRTRKCKIVDCTNYVINRGLCFRHGGGKKCSVADCNSSAKNAGLCWRHGGSVKCIVGGCDRRGKSRGLCWAHGGGTKCQQGECEKVAVSNGFCWAHGGGKRCALDGCGRAAYERTRNYCRRHYEELKSEFKTTDI